MVPIIKLWFTRGLKRSCFNTTLKPIMAVGNLLREAEGQQLSETSTPKDTSTVVVSAYAPFPTD
eukprot:4081315-Amphidinium_carterae.1